ARIGPLDAPALQVRRQINRMENPRTQHLADLARSNGITHGAVACGIAQMMVGAGHDTRLAHGFQQLVRVIKRQRQRLFAKYMLARLCRCNRLSAVQFIGGGDINGIDFRVGQKRFKAGHGAGYAVFAGISFTAPGIGAVNGNDLAPGGANGSDHPFLRNGACAYKAPLCHSSFSSCFRNGAPQLARTARRTDRRCASASTRSELICFSKSCAARSPKPCGSTATVVSAGTAVLASITSSKPTTPKSRPGSRLAARSPSQTPKATASLKHTAAVGFMPCRSICSTTSTPPARDGALAKTSASSKAIPACSSPARYPATRSANTAVSA